jgi:hypothetical protein
MSLHEPFVSFVVAQQMAYVCCFIDDWALDLGVAMRLGMHTIEKGDVQQLSKDLRKPGVG